MGYALGDFHRELLRGKSIAIACPKLDQGQDIYQEKIKARPEDAKINALTVLIMQVRCCMGLLSLSQLASQSFQRKAPVKYMVVSVQGEILREEWV